jgi:hypothetical protein
MLTWSTFGYFCWSCSIHFVWMNLSYFSLSFIVNTNPQNFSSIFSTPKQRSKLFNELNKYPPIILFKSNQIKNIFNTKRTYPLKSRNVEWEDHQLPFDNKLLYIVHTLMPKTDTIYFSNFKIKQTWSLLFSDRII